MSASPETDQSATNRRREAPCTARVFRPDGQARRAASRSSADRCPRCIRSGCVTGGGCEEPRIRDIAVQRPSGRRFRRRRQSVGHRRGPNGLLPPGNAGVYKYDPYPSQNLLAAPSTYATGGPAYFFRLHRGRQIHRSLRNRQSNGTDSQHLGQRWRPISKSWTGINGVRVDLSRGIRLAIDNTSSYSRRPGLPSLTSPRTMSRRSTLAASGSVPGKASYIDGNRITGTPTGPFGESGARGRRRRQHLCYRREKQTRSTSSTRPASSSGRFQPPCAIPEFAPAAGSVATTPTNCERADRRRATGCPNSTRPETSWKHSRAWGRLPRPTLQAGCTSLD